MKMLFMDIEWNQPANVLCVEECDIMQIASIGISEDNDGEKTFFKLVKPRNPAVIKKNTYRLMGLSEKVLFDAKPLQVVMDAFFQRFSDSELFVVWNRESYEVFMYQAEQLGYKRKLSKCCFVILQEVIGDITWHKVEKMGIKAALRNAGISFEENLLHRANHDVKYLKMLYEKIYREYVGECEREMDKICYMSVRSRMLHSDGCRYMAAIADGNLVITDKARVLYGARVCKYCSGQRRFAKLRWKECRNRPPVKLKPSFGDAYIYEVCEHFGVKCQIGNGVIFVNTGMARWRIYHDDEKVTGVYHENYRVKKDEFCKKKKCNEGYHRQNIKVKSLYEVIRYIESHDSHFFTRISKNRGRIDRLFDKIEREKTKKQMEEMLKNENYNE